MPHKTPSTRAASKHQTLHIPSHAHAPAAAAPSTGHDGKAPASGHTAQAFGATDLLLVLMATIWGVNFSSVKYAMHFVSPATFTALRISISAMTMFIVVALQRKTLPSRRDMLGLAGLGIIGNGVYQLLFANGVARTRIADAALIVAAAPAFIAILSHIRGIERVTVRAIAGIVLSVIGVGIVIVGSATHPQRTGTVAGAALMVCAVLCWTVFSVGLRPYSKYIDPVQLNAFTMVGGLLPLVVTIPSVVATPWAQVTPLAWGCVLYASVISMGVAYLFYMRGLRILGPTRTSIYGNLQPPIAILVAWVLLGEIPTMWQGAGAGLIIGGIVLTRT